MGAGCSSSSSTVVDTTGKRAPTSQASARLIGALGGLLANPPAPKQENDQANQAQPQWPPPRNNGPPFPPSPEKPNETLVLSPGVEILPLPDKPLLKQRQTIRQPSKLALDPLPGEIALEDGENDAEEDPVEDNHPPLVGEKSNSALEPIIIDENRRRRNSISILPSIEPKGKLTINQSEKKNDADLVLWIANKLKTKLKLSRISKAYDRYNYGESI